MFVFLGLLLIFLVLSYQNSCFFFLQISSEEINQNSLKWQIYQTVKEIKLLVLLWQAPV